MWTSKLQLLFRCWSTTRSANSSSNVRRIVTPTSKKPTGCALHMMRWSFKCGHQGITFAWRLTKATTWFPFTRTADCPLQNNITTCIQFSLPCPVKPLQAIHMNYRNPMRKTNLKWVISYTELLLKSGTAESSRCGIKKPDFQVFSTWAKRGEKKEKATETQLRGPKTGEGKHQGLTSRGVSQQGVT